MSPLLVYRIEDEFGKGPWSSEYNMSDRFRAGALDINRMKTSYNESFVGWDWRSSRDNVGYRHGFAPAQLDELVGPLDRKRLRQVPFFLNIYMCPPGTFAYGTEQIIFDPAAAIRAQAGLI